MRGLECIMFGDPCVVKGVVSVGLKMGGEGGKSGGS